MDTADLRKELQQLMPFQYREFLDWREMLLLATNRYRQTYDLGILTAPVAQQDRDALLGIIESCKRALCSILGRNTLLVYREGSCDGDTIANFLEVVERWNPDTEAATMYPPKENHSGAGDGRRFRSGQ